MRLSLFSQKKMGVPCRNMGAKYNELTAVPEYTQPMTPRSWCSHTPAPWALLSWVQALPWLPEPPAGPSSGCPHGNWLANIWLAAFPSLPPFLTPDRLPSLPHFPVGVSWDHLSDKRHASFFQGPLSREHKLRCLPETIVKFEWGRMSGTELRSRGPSINSSYYYFFSLWFWSVLYSLQLLP